MYLFILGACLIRGNSTESEDKIQDTESGAYPEVLQITILKDGVVATDVFNDDTLRCEAVVDDLDDIVSPNYLWVIGDVEMGTSQDLTLDAGLAIPGDDIGCVVTVSDSAGNSASDSQSVEVQNRLPSAPSVVISPDEPISGVDDLTCSASNSVDPDGDDISYAYTWESVGGIVEEGGSLPASFASLDSEWSCTATSQDPFALGASTTASVELRPNVICDIEPCDASLPLIQTQVDFVRIPAGSDPLGRYTITQDFYIQNVEITNAHFFEASGFTPVVGLSAEDYQAADSTHISFSDGSFPAGFVTWSMAAHYTNDLTTVYNNQNSEDLAYCYTCDGTESDVTCMAAMNPYECSGFRLPTAAEWEYAARSGTTSEIWTEYGGGLIYEFDVNPIGCEEAIIQDGEESPLSNYAWYCYYAEDESQYGYSDTVAQRMPNGFGLYDLHGNVAEWTADTYLDFEHEMLGENPYTTINDSTLPHLLFGGAMSSMPSSLAFGAAIQMTDESRFSFLGFRVVRTALD